MPSVELDLIEASALLTALPIGSAGRKLLVNRILDTESSPCRVCGCHVAHSGNEVGAKRCMYYRVSVADNHVLYRHTLGGAALMTNEGVS